MFHNNVAVSCNGVFLKIACSQMAGLVFMHAVVSVFVVVQ
jgi:hypothetical protein